MGALKGGRLCMWLLQSSTSMTTCGVDVSKDERAYGWLLQPCMSSTRRRMGAVECERGKRKVLGVKAIYRNDL